MRRACAVLASLLALGAGFLPLVAAQARVGTRAADFTLVDSRGVSRTLSNFTGRFVVLEWSNHECPFVRKQYDSGKMQELQATYTGRGVIWLTVVSSAPGKQGHVSREQANAIIAQRHAKQTAMLLDEEGAVGRLYGAKTTPHMFIIDPAGVVIYAGAIDDRPSVNPADPAAATNYVQRALEEAMAGQPVSIAATPSYGCSVKY